MKNRNNVLKNGLFAIGIFFILMVGGYEISYPTSIPPIFAQMIPRAVQTNDNITTNSGSDTTTTHTSYTIEGSKALLNSKLPLIKKAVISQVYSAMGITQKAGANNTVTNLNALITNEIDNSTSSSSSLETTRSLAGAQVANAIHKVTTMVNSNSDGNDLASMKVVIDNEAKCSNSDPVTALHCNLNIRIHK
ncbi:MAG: hypothetical protein WBQ25_16810 [Nitrososphaeraceae archaeon]